MKKNNLFQMFILVGLISLITMELNAKSVERPRLILTSARIELLKSSIATTHIELWNYALQSAENFSGQEISEMKDAHNKYRPIGDTMPVLGLAYMMTGDQKYIEAAERWIKALLAVPEWKGSQNLGRSSWMVGTALLYDWLYDEFDDEFRQNIRDKLIEESNAIFDHNSGYRALSNHLLIETSALGITGLSLQGEFDKANDLLNQADKWAQYIINHAPLDGSWGEGIMYWQYGNGYFYRYLEACKTSGRNNYFPDYNWLQQPGYFPIYFSLPARSREVINFSDCGVKRYLPPYLMYLPASKYGNGLFQDFGYKLETGKPHKFSWLDLICFDASIKAQDIHTLPTLKHFSDNDFVTMRSGWGENATVIGFRCGPAPGHKNQHDPTRIENQGFGPGHSHPDINSFNIFSKGEWLAIDPGYTYEKLTRNHNTIIVNGFGQSGAGKKWMDYMTFESRDPAPAILMVESNNVYDYLIGDTGNIYMDEAQLKSYRRHLLFLKPDIVVIADDLQTKSESKFEWLLNAADTIVQNDKKQFEIIKNDVRLCVQPLLPQELKAEFQKKKIKISQKKDEAHLKGGLLRTLNLQIDSVAATRFLVVLAVLKDAKELKPEITFDKNILTISHSQKLWKVSYKENVSQHDDPILVVDEPERAEVYYKFLSDSRD